MLPDEKYHERLVTLWEEFWSYFSEGQIPPMMQGDMMDKSSDIELVALSEQYQLAKVNLSKAKDIEKSLRDRLTEHATKNTVRVNNIVIERIVKRGSIDWKRLQDDQQLDDSLVEQYRKPSTMYHRIREFK